MKNMPQIDKVEMMRCSGCNDFHPVTDCEIVIIKLVKGKECKINQGNVFGEAPTRSHVPQIFKDTPQVVETPAVPSAPRKTIIPPRFLEVMRPPGTPGEAFERRTA